MKVLLVVYDNETFLNYLPQGLAYIAAILRNNGYYVSIYKQDLHHYKDKELTGYLDKHHFDVIGISFVGGYFQYKKVQALAKAINSSKNRPYFIMGGHGPAPEPKFFLKKTQADAVVIGEGEVTILELLEAVASKNSLSGIDGIAYRDGDTVFINKRRSLIKDIDTIPFPAFDLFPMEYYRMWRLPHAEKTDFLMNMLSGRGCPFRCNFCYRMDKGFRARSNESIIEEIKLLKKDYGITYIAFSDELLMTSAKRTIKLCEDFIKDNLNIKFYCNGRLNYAEPEVLKIMKRAGCVFINYGIEAMDDRVLENMNKQLTTEKIIKGIENTLDIGISPGFNIIWGNIGDTAETLNKGVEFLLKYDDGAQLRTIRPVTPYPGSDLYYYALGNGLLKDCEDFYENKFSILMELIVAEYPDNIKFIQKKESMKLESDNNTDSPEEVLSFVIDFVKKLLTVYKIEA